MECAMLHVVNWRDRSIDKNRRSSEAILFATDSVDFP